MRLMCTPVLALLLMATGFGSSWGKGMLEKLKKIRGYSDVDLETGKEGGESQCL
jgi:hypothetical protein